jgi:carboxyl-terminal processing protease
MKRKISLYLFALLLIISTKSFAQPSLTANQAFDKAQDARSKAGDLWGKDHPTKTDLEQGINILNKTLLYLDSVPVKQLAQTNIFLWGRKHDIYFDLSMAYCLAGQNEQALTALENMCNEGSYYFIPALEKDAVYSNIRQDPRFVKVLNTLKNRESLWEGTSFKTPYKENLSDEEKAAGLSMLWSQAKYNFVHFEHVDIDWDKSYLDYLSKIKNTKSTEEYYRVLQTFYAQLKDGHTNVYPPRELGKEFYSRPPIVTELIEGRVFITTVYSDSLKAIGITPGLEILKIDGTPVLTYAKTNVEPYQSAATLQDMAVRDFTYGLLSGSADKPVLLELKDNKGKIWTKSLTRSGYHNVKYPSGFSYREIGNIGYLTINNFESNKIIKKFDSLFTTIATTKALIIDVRNNGGGDSYIGDHILASLTDTAFKTEGSRIIRYNSIPGIGAQWQENGAGTIKASGKQYYSKPVVLLVSARTYSAAEDFVLAFDFMKRGKLIGQATGGSTGQPYSFNLPGGGSARVCAKDAYYPDGKAFIDIGILPNITVEKTVKDLEDGKDAALDKAVAVLNE